MVLLRSAQILWGARCTTALLTVTGIDEHLLMAAAAGAKGYLFKSDQAADWLDTIRALAMGQSPLHAKLAHSFCSSSAPEPALPMQTTAVRAPRYPGCSMSRPMPCCCT
ncbi:hypothetical protein Y695_03138 [Hydrogenophaga sp. T4]|nr:hypothetical protein Y695_03138 [Hydrogenophaga sp. T4]